MFSIKLFLVLVISSVALAETKDLDFLNFPLAGLNPGDILAALGNVREGWDLPLEDPILVPREYEIIPGLLYCRNIEVTGLSNSKFNYSDYETETPSFGGAYLKYTTSEFQIKGQYSFSQDAENWIDFTVSLSNFEISGHLAVSYLPLTEEYTFNFDKLFLKFYKFAENDLVDNIYWKGVSSVAQTTIKTLEKQYHEQLKTIFFPVALYAAYGFAWAHTPCFEPTNSCNVICALTMPQCRN